MRTFLTILMVYVLLPAANAWAAIPKPPAELKRETPWLGYGIAILLFLAVCAGMFKPSKRSHLD